MKSIFKIIIMLSFVQLTVFGQDAPGAENQRRYREQSYFSAHLDYAYTFLNGTGGNEKAQYYRDYIQDLNNNGIAAEGGIFGRDGLSFGVAYDQYLSKRYALHFQTSYWQTGYREKLSVAGKIEEDEIIREKSLIANLDYFHILAGLKYYNDYGLTLTLGGFVNYNILDKVKYDEVSKVTGRFGESDTSINQSLYFHEHYGQNRTVFLTGGVFMIGYKYYDIEFDASIKFTGSILEETDDFFFNVYQFGIRYTLPTKREDN